MQPVTDVQQEGGRGSNTEEFVSLSHRTEEELLNVAAARQADMEDSGWLLLHHKTP